MFQSARTGALEKTLLSIKASHPEPAEWRVLEWHLVELT